MAPAGTNPTSERRWRWAERQATAIWRREGTGPCCWCCSGGWGWKEKEGGEGEGPRVGAAAGDGATAAAAAAEAAGRGEGGGGVWRAGGMRGHPPGEGSILVDNGGLRRRDGKGATREKLGRGRRTRPRNGRDARARARVRVRTSKRQGPAREDPGGVEILERRGERERPNLKIVACRGKATGRGGLVFIAARRGAPGSRVPPAAGPPRQERRFRLARPRSHTTNRARDLFGASLTTP